MIVVLMVVILCVPGTGVEPEQEVALEAVLKPIQGRKLHFSGAASTHRDQGSRLWSSYPALSHLLITISSGCSFSLFTIKKEFP
jgi:hypothetical protein